MPPVAVIDIGTNSIKMVAAKLSPAGEVAIVDQGREITRLGEGLAASGRISSEAMGRTLTAFSALAQQAKDAGATRIAAIGTAALRDAANADEFVEKAREVTGLSIEVITGDREAELAYRAVRHDPELHLPAETELLVFDIGGGSTELVCGKGDSVAEFTSLPLGAVRLTEQFLKSDPPAQRESEAARSEAEGRLLEFHACRTGKVVIAGVGGTVVNVASIAVGGVGDIAKSELTRPQVDNIAQQLLALPLAERRRVPGLEPARADIILGGIAILDALLASFNAVSFRVSTLGIRYALLWELLSTRISPPRPELGEGAGG